MTMAYMGDKEVKQADCVLGTERSLTFVHCHSTQAHGCRVSRSQRQSTADDLGLGEWRRDGRLRSPRVEGMQLRPADTVRMIARGHDVNVDPVDDGAASRFAHSFTVSNAGLRPSAVKLQLG